MRVRSQFGADPRVESIDSVTIESLDADALKISVMVIPVGRARTDKPLPVQILIR
jgi:hypothetical protein